MGVYIQIKGESDVMLIPQNHTETSFGAHRHPTAPSLEAIRSDPYLKNVPLVVFHMSPGDGLVFPGRTYHVFGAQTIDRVALNFFFIPRWRKMEYMKEDWYS